MHTRYSKLSNPLTDRGVSIAERPRCGMCEPVGDMPKKEGARP